LSPRAGAPTLSAIAIITPPCSTPNVVHSSGRQASWATTSSGAAASNSRPRPVLNGIIATMSVRLGAVAGSAVSSLMSHHSGRAPAARP